MPETLADYLARQDQEERQRKAQTAAAGVSITSVSPDQAAASLRLMKEFSQVEGANRTLPRSFVEQYKPKLEQVIREKKATTILSNSPKLADWLAASEDNTAVASDDLEGLSWFEGFGRGAWNTAKRAGQRIDMMLNQAALEKTAGRARDRNLTLGQLIDDERLVVKGKSGTEYKTMAKPGDVFSGLARWVDAKYADLIGTDDEANAQDYAARLDAGRKALAATPKSEIATTFEREAMVDGAGLGDTLANFGRAIARNPIGALSWSLETAGESAPTLIAAGATTAVTRNPGAGVAVLGAGSYATERYTSPAEFFQEKGLDLSNRDDVARLIADPSLMKEAQERGVIRGAVIGAFDAVSGGVAGKALAKNPLVEALAQGVAQAVTGSAGELSARLAAGQNLDWNEIVAEGVAEMATTPIDMGIAGRKFVRDRDAAKAATAQAGEIDALSSSAQASALRARMPDSFREFLAQATEDGPVENVYVPAEDFVQYFQDQGIDPWELMDDFDGVTRDDLDAALAGGGDLQIPTATYAAKIAGSEADPFFMENMRFSPDAMTAREAMEFNERAGDVMQEAWDEAERMRVEEEALRGVEEKIYVEMQSRLRQAGRTTDVANSEAMLYPAFYRVMAERSGLTTDEFLARYPLPRVEGARPEGMQTKDVTAFTRTLAEARMPRAKVKRGQSLLEFIAARGGIDDPGGELRARDAETVKRGDVLVKNKKTGKRHVRAAKVLRLARDTSGDGQISMMGDAAGGKYGVDDVAQAVIDAGFMADNPDVIAYKEAMRAGGEVPDITRALWDAIDRELRGEAQYSAEVQDTGEADTNEALDQIEEYLASLGVSLDNSDDEILAAVRQDEEGRRYAQAPAVGSEAFLRWAGTDEIIEADEVNDFDFSGPGPFVMRAFHGTTHDIEAFDASLRGNKEGQFGAVNYFTTSKGDADRNYAGEGPDLTNRIEGRAEQLSQELEQRFENEGRAEVLNELYKQTGELRFVSAKVADMDDVDAAYDAGRVLAKRELAGSNPQTLEVYVRTEKPFIVGDGSPFMAFMDFEALEARAIEVVAENNGLTVNEVRADLDTYQDEIDDARWEVESEAENPLLSAIQTVADRNGIDPTQILEDVAEFSSEGGRQSDLEAALRASEGLAYAEDYDTGGLIGYHVLGEIIQELGFDSIVLKNAEERFSNMGMEPGTVHVHVFDKNSTNIKSVNNRGTFDPADARILYQDAAPSIANVEALAADLGVSLGITENATAINVGKIVAGERGQGAGSRVMEALTDYADAVGKRVTLTPSTDFGGSSVKRLTDFYKRFGFVENKGRNKDFTVSEGMIREPRQLGVREYYQSAYHGSPHLFDKFSLDAIGTGEGAQAYGWGLYFAGRREIAEHYRNTLTLDVGFDYAGKTGLNRAEVQNLVNMKYGGRYLDNVARASGVADKVMDDLIYGGKNNYKEGSERRAVYDEIAAELKRPENTGRLYEVEIPDDGEYLLWDKPLSEQPEKVKAALEAMGAAVDPADRPTIQASASGKTFKVMSPGGWELATFRSESAAEAYIAKEFPVTEPSGKDLYRKISVNNGSDRFGSSRSVGDRAASLALHDAGIAGIKYLDGGSRADGDGSFNYVVFDDNRVSIRAYEQNNGSGPRGSVQFPMAGVGNGDTIIRLSERADLSTFLHESGHYFLTVMQDMAARGEQSAAAEYAAIKGWWRENADAVAKDANRAAGKQAGVLNQSAALPETIDIDGVARPTTNSEGQPVASTEAGVRAFWNWFGNSKVVDAEGRPLVVYHSALEEKSQFDRTGKFMGYTGVSGISVTDNPEMASRYLDRYGDRRYDGVLFEKNILPLYVRAENPLYRDEPLRGPVPMGAPLPEGYVNPIERQGYDALIRSDAISRKGPVKHSDAKNAIRGREIVVFDPTQIKSINNRGTFDPNDARILYQGDIGQPEAVVVTAEDVIRAIDTGTSGDSVKDMLIDVGMQEQWARAFEQYVMEGKAPSAELRSAFERFRAWLLSIYRKLTGLNVNVSDDLRRVFDRMLATDEEIASAQADAGDGGPLFATAEEMGLAPDEFDRFTKLRLQAEEEAKARLLAETMAPIRREREKWYREEREAVRQQVEAEINARPEYRAIEWLGNRRWLGEGQPEAMPDMRLSKTVLVERYGAGITKTLPRGKYPVYAVEGGFDPDEVAGWFGFDSGDAMISAMERAQPRKQAIDAETDKRMYDAHGDVLNDGSVQEEALAAIHGEKRARVLALELDALNRKIGNDQPTRARQVREIARRTINRMKVRDAMNAKRFLAAERKAAAAAYRAIAEGNIEEAAAQKYRQLLNHSLYSEARAVEEEVGKAERFVAGLNKSSKREKIAGAGRRENAQIDYLGAIDELLDRYDFRRMSGRAEDRRGSLVAFVEAMKAAGRERELAIPEDVLTDAARVPYKTLPVEALRGVIASLKNLEHVALRWNDLIDAQQRREFEATVGDLIGEFEANVERRPPGRVGTAGERLRNAGRQFIDLVLNASTILREIDGFRDMGGAYQAIKAPIDAAMNRLTVRKRQAAIDLEALYDVYSRDERRAMSVRKLVPELGYSLSKWEMIAVALNTGNEGNYQRLTDPRVRGSLSEDQVQAVLANLDERDAKFVQSVWDYLETFRPDIAARERRATGVEPEWVEAKPVTIAGRDLKGGYYPLRYDPRLSSLARDDAENDIAQAMQSGRFGKAQTKNGHLQARAQSSGRDVMLDMSVLHRHVNTVIYDLELSEPVANAWRVLQAAPVRDQFIQTGKQADFDALETWLKDVAEGQVGSADWMGSAARTLKSNFTASKLAFNLGTVAVQVTGLSQTMVVVGKRDFLRGLQASFRPGIRDEIAAKSAFMAERQTTFNKDITDFYDDPKLGPLASRWGEFKRDIIGPASFWLMTKVQWLTVDVPSWLAGYEQGLRKFDGDEAQAIAYADGIVKRAQSSGLFSDRSAIERGSVSRNTRQNDVIRLFTTLGSYMFAKFNVAYERTAVASREIGRAGVSVRAAQEALSWSLDMAFLFTLEAVAVAAIKGGLPDGDDEDEDGWLEFLAKETAFSVMGTLPFIRDAASSLKGFDGGGAYGSAIDTMVKAGKGAYNVLTAPFVEDGEVKRTDVKAVINGTGLATGLPSTQINRGVDAAWRQAEGEDVSPAEYLLGKSQK